MNSAMTVTDIEFHMGQCIEPRNGGKNKIAKTTTVSTAAKNEAHPNIHNNYNKRQIIKVFEVATENEYKLLALMTFFHSLARYVVSTTVFATCNAKNSVFGGFVKIE